MVGELILTVMRHCDKNMKCWVVSEFVVFRSAKERPFAERKATLGQTETLPNADDVKRLQNKNGAGGMIRLPHDGHRLACDSRTSICLTGRQIRRAIALVK